MAEKPIDFAKYLHNTLQKGTNKVETIRMMCKQFDEFLCHNKAVLAQASSESETRVNLSSLGRSGGGGGRSSSVSAAIGGNNDALMRFRCPNAVIDRRQNRRYTGITSVGFTAPPNESHMATSTVSLADVMLAGVRSSLECIVVDIFIESWEPTTAVALPPGAATSSTTSSQQVSQHMMPQMGVGFVSADKPKPDGSRKRLVDLTFKEDGVAWFSDHSFYSAAAADTIATTPLGSSTFTGGTALSLTVERLRHKTFRATLTDENLYVSDSQEITLPDQLAADQCFLAISCAGVASTVLVCVRPDPSFPPVLPLSPSIMSSREPSTVEHAHAASGGRGGGGGGSGNTSIAGVVTTSTGGGGAGSGAGRATISAAFADAVVDGLMLSPTTTRGAQGEGFGDGTQTTQTFLGDEFVLVAQGTTASALLDRVVSERLIRVDCEAFAEGAYAILCDPSTMVGHTYLVAGVSSSFRVGVLLGTREDAERKRLCPARKLAEVGLSIGIIEEHQHAQQQSPHHLQPVTSSSGSGSSSNNASPKGAAPPQQQEQPPTAVSDYILVVETKHPQLFTVTKHVYQLHESVKAASDVRFKVRYDEQHNTICLDSVHHKETMAPCLLQPPQPAPGSPTAATTTARGTTATSLLVGATTTIATVNVPGADLKVHFGCGCIGGGSIVLKRWFNPDVYNED